VPKPEQAENLFVPVCLAATHIAYGSIRMEPVFMIMGQSAATAAVFAIDARSTVQKVDYAKLQARLLQDGQILGWTGQPRQPAAPKPQLDGLVLDDEQAVQTGEWRHGSSGGNARVGEGYLHDGDTEKGQLRVVWTPEIKTAGEYEIVLHFPFNANRAKNVPVTVAVGTETRTVKVDQQDKSNRQSLGRFQLPAGRGTQITLSNEGTTGHVIADGVQIIKTGK
jgi:hypothetical protein